MEHGINESKLLSFIYKRSTLHTIKKSCKHFCTFATIFMRRTEPIKTSGLIVVFVTECIPTSSDESVLPFCKYFYELVRLKITMEESLSVDTSDSHMLKLENKGQLFPFGCGEHQRLLRRKAKYLSDSHCVMGFKAFFVKLM